jgi:hypothetical protein
MMWHQWCWVDDDDDDDDIVIHVKLNLVLTAYEKLSHESDMMLAK